MSTSVWRSGRPGLSAAVDAQDLSRHERASRIGAGKTAPFEVMTGSDEPTSGRVLVAGTDIHRITYRERDRSRSTIARERMPLPMGEDTLGVGRGRSGADALVE